MSHIQKAIQEKKVVIDYTDKAPWSKFSPDDRLKVYRKCGEACFAKPIRASTQQIQANPTLLKFPICRPNARVCKISPSGLLASNRRARLTKKYPGIVRSTTKLIKTYGTTDTSLQDLEIKRVRIDETPLPTGKFMTTIVYTNGVQKSTPYTKRHILKQFGGHLSKALHKRLSSSV